MMMRGVLKKILKSLANKYGFDKMFDKISVLSKHKVGFWATYSLRFYTTIMKLVIYLPNQMKKKLTAWFIVYEVQKASSN